MDPRKVVEKSEKEEKKKRRAFLSIQTKQEIIEKHERGMRLVDLAKEYGRNASTICSVLKQKEVLKAVTPSKGLSVISKRRSAVNDKMERLLLVWIKEKEIAGDIMTGAIICKKATAIYNNLVTEGAAQGTSVQERTQEFKASRGWFEKFRRRTGIYSVLRRGELFASGLCCENSPEFDDLFGFSVKDVLEEVKRGKKLMCCKCKKKGATAGCEVRRCKRSYHYPCAVENGAKTIEETERGRFILYCPQHHLKTTGNGTSTNGSSPIASDQSPCQAGPSKKRTVGSPNHPEPSSKRLFLNSENCKALANALEDSSDSDLSIFAPLETDIDEDEEPQQPEARNAMEDLKGSAGAFHQTLGGDGWMQSQSGNGSFSSPAARLRRISSSDETPPEPGRLSLDPAMATNVGTQTSVTKATTMVVKVNVHSKEEPSPVYLPASPTAVASAPLPSHAEVPGVSTSSPHPVSFPPVASVSSCTALEPSIDSASFWKSCNEAGCTKAIFSGFFQEMSNMADRIQQDRASQEDYDLALLVMEASGKLEHLVNKQNEEIQRKQMEVCKVVAAMKQILSTLKR
eukprot:XP_011606841.1 PREDICTED: PHD finger protein 11 isoform X4 [Takifugu rubripes]